MFLKFLIPAFSTFAGARPDWDESDLRNPSPTTTTAPPTSGAPTTTTQTWGSTEMISATILEDILGVWLSPDGINYYIYDNDEIHNNDSPSQVNIMITIDGNEGDNLIGMIPNALVRLENDRVTRIVKTIRRPCCARFAMDIGPDQKIATVNGVAGITKFEWPEQTTTTTIQPTTLIPISIFDEITGGWIAADGSQYTIVDDLEGSVNIFALDSSGKFTKMSHFLAQIFQVIWRV